MPKINQEEYEALRTLKKTGFTEVIRNRELRYSIADLIEEYVKQQFEETYGHDGEGEETEVKDIEQLKEKLQGRLDKLPNNKYNGLYSEGSRDAYQLVLQDINQLDEPEVLSSDWIDKNVVHVRGLGDIIEAEAVENLLVPKQEEVDQAYKDGYEKGKQHTFYKGYLEGLADKENEPETVASVIADFYKSFERFKEVISMEVEELEE